MQTLHTKRFSGWFVLALIGPMLGAGPAEPKRPNIVFIFSDDHAYQAISAYGDPRKLIETPEHRPDRPRRDAVRPLRRAQLDLRAEPGVGPDRQVFAPQRLLQQHQQPVRRLAADLPQDAQGGRLPDGRHRQVAPRLRAHRLRRVAHPAGAGGLLQPAHDPQRQARQARRLHHRPHHRLQPRLAQGARQVEALPPDVPAEGPASRVGAADPPPRPRRRPRLSRARHPLRRLRRPRARPSTTRT